MAQETQKHLYDLLKDFSTAMLVTHRSSGYMHARPMAVAQLRPDASAYFATSIDSPKIREIEKDPRVLVTFQGSSSFAVIEGVAVVETNKELIGNFWNEAWRMWFPGGEADPKLCLLRVDAASGEYWDRSGVEGLKFLFEGVKAIVEGTTPEITDPAQHANVKLDNL